MYRCTDCGQEYKIKPDYCDCGNDLFEEIVEKEKPVQTASASFIPLQRVHEKTVDFPSLLIFFICIVLSILSWIFIGREPAATVQPKSTPAPQKVVNLPPIDKLWKDSALPQKTIEVKAIDVQPVPVPTKTVTRIAAPKPVQPKSVMAPQQVVKQQPQTPKTPTPSMTEQQKQEIIKKLTTTKTQLPAQQVEKSTAQIEKKPEPPKVDLAAQKRELNAYKTALRNKLGGNINFAAVIGDGKCSITFKLDSSGNLINRAFSIQSSNDSLNDAVYAAMMQNPTFKAPPEGYKNETLTLTVQIYGGQFEVGLR